MIQKLIFRYFLLMVLLRPCFLHILRESNMTSYLAKNPYFQGKSEIVFLLDRSASIGAAEFETGLEFVKFFLTHIVVDSNATRISVISYSDTTTRHIDCLSEPKTKSFLYRELQDIVYENRGASNIAAALQEAKIVLQKARPQVNKVIVLISNGIATRGGSPTPVANELKEDGIQIFCFGVGRFQRPELEKLASSSQDVYSCSEFKEFKKLSRNLREVTECRVPQSLQNGFRRCILDEKTSLPIICVYKCREGFRLEGPQVLRCTKDGRLAEPNDRPGFPRCVVTGRNCEINNGGCSHYCTTTPTSDSKCTCPYGYVLKRDHQTCVACPEGTYQNIPDHCRPCPRGSTTANVASTKRSDCYCMEGYSGNLNNEPPCTIIECYELLIPRHGTMECEQGQLTLGKKCNFECDNGYTLQGSRMRECRSDKSWSGSETKCIHECGENKLGCSDKCVETIGGAYCVCDPGFKLQEDNKTCADIDECGENNFGCSGKCVNTLGDAYCLCESGFKLQGDNKTCVDVDECTENNFGCSGQCVNTVGDAYCLCESGFNLQEDNKTCIDIDECRVENRCTFKCLNTPGGYHCVCRPGYKQLDQYTCQGCELDFYWSSDMNACVRCPENAYTKGEGMNYISDCICKPGYSGYPKRGIPCVGFYEPRKKSWRSRRQLPYM